MTETKFTRAARSMNLSLAQASVNGAIIDRLHSTVYRSLDTTLAPSTECRCMKCNTNNIKLILTLTLNPNPILNPNPNRRSASRERREEHKSVRGWGAARSAIWQAKYRDPS